MTAQPGCQLDDGNDTAGDHPEVGVGPEVLVGLHLSLVHPTDRFEASTMARLAGQYRRLLGEVAADPSRPLSELAAPSRAASR